MMNFEKTLGVFLVFAVLSSVGSCTIQSLWIKPKDKNRDAFMIECIESGKRARDCIILYELKEGVK